MTTLPETLYLAVNIIVRSLSARVVSLVKLQLVGITCMFIRCQGGRNCGALCNELPLLC